MLILLFHNSFHTTILVEYKIIAEYMICADADWFDAACSDLYIYENSSSSSPSAISAFS